MMKIEQELMILRDALGEVHASLAKVHFIGNRLFGDEFDNLMKANTSLRIEVHESAVIKGADNED